MGSALAKRVHRKTRKIRPRELIPSVDKEALFPQTLALFMHLCLKPPVTTTMNRSSTDAKGNELQILAASCLGHGVLN